MHPALTLDRQLLDSALDHAIVACDAQGLITSFSRGASVLLGVEPQRMLGQPLAQLFSAEDVQAGVPARLLEQAAREGRAREERWFAGAHGRLFWGEATLTPLQDAAGQPAATGGALLVLQDRSAQWRQAQRGRQLSRDQAFLAQVSAELAALTDYQQTLDRIARLAVPRFADWCAVELLEGGALRRVATAHADPERLAQVEALRERHAPDPQAPRGAWQALRSGKPVLVPELTPEVLARDIATPALREAMAALGLRSYIVAPLAARGQNLGVLAFASAESGRIYGEADVALAEDLARRASVAIENARLLQQLREADRAKDVFLATLAHELRNPLAPIWNGLSIIKHVPGDRQRVEQVTAIIERQVGQLSRLVDDLLDVSRIATGKIELRKERVSLVQVLTTAVEMSRPHIEAAQHKLSLSFPEQPTEVLADPARLAQVFANLLNNAARYTRRGGRIDVLVEAPDDELIVRVRDNGVGIPHEMLERVFGLFTQAGRPGERRQGGLGIGLSLVQGLVRLHGGTVQAHSDGPERGSEFTVRLPRLQREPQPAQPARPADAAAGPPRRVLVVDDNADTANTVAQLLELAGNEVDVVHDGGAAVERTGSFRPDVVLLDIGLPDISGYEAARRIRKLEGVRQPTLIALTGWGQQQDKEQAAEAGFDQHWTKPVDPDRLRELAPRRNGG